MSNPDPSKDYADYEGVKTMKQVRVLRVIEYVGDETWIKDQIENSIHGVKKIDGKNGKGEIRCATVGIYPEILQDLEDVCTDCNHDASFHNNGAHCQYENCTCKAFN